MRIAADARGALLGLTLVEAVASRPLARRLPLLFDPDALQRDLSALTPWWWRKHQGPYHDGAWEVVSLWAPRGDLYEQTTRGGPFEATEALARVPAIGGVLEALPGRRNRVRLLRLRPGGHIQRHYDPMERLAPDLVRLHVPVTSNPDVDFRVSDRRIEMRPGETWHIDVRFVHEVKNLGKENRIHLVADLHWDARVESLLASAEPIGQGRLVSYYLKQAVPKRLRRALGVAN